MQTRTATLSPNVLSLRTLGWLAVALLLAMALVPAAGVRSVFAAEPVAIYTSLEEEVLEGNPTCAAYADDFGGDQVWVEVKKDPAGNGDINTSAGTITVSNFDNDGAEKGFTWTSTFGIDAVLAKNGGGNGGYNVLYVYADHAGATEATSGTFVTGSPTEISHISFCWDETNPTPTPTPEPTPTPTPEPTPTPTPEGSVGGETGTPTITLPPTDTIGGPAAPSSDSWRMMLVLMAGVLASALILTPNRVTRRR